MSDEQVQVEWDFLRGRVRILNRSTESATEDYRVRVDREDGSHEEFGLLAESADSFTIREWSADPESPIRALTLLGAGDHPELVTVSRLFPHTDREFETQFKSNRDRTLDAHTDFFIASQIFTHFEGQLGYRLSCAVICGYQAIELQDELYLERAEEMLREALELVSGVGMDRSTRNNREHLRISLLCVQWHVYLAQGNSQGFASTLLAIKALVAAGGFATYFNLTFNSAVSLRALVLIYRYLGAMRQARETAELAHQMFQFCVRDSDGNLNHFKEVGYVHGFVYGAMYDARRAKVVNKKYVRRALPEVLRVKKAQHPEAVKQLVENFIDATSEFDSPELR